MREKGGALEAEGSTHNEKKKRIADSVAEARSGGAGDSREVAQGKTSDKRRCIIVSKTLPYHTKDVA
jgi:hypothetical protein